jgi:hypothetical protein
MGCVSEGSAGKGLMHVTKQQARDYHSSGRPGKIEVTPPNLAARRTELLDAAAIGK